MDTGDVLLRAETIALLVATGIAGFLIGYGVARALASRGEPPVVGADPPAPAAAASPAAPAIPSAAAAPAPQAPGDDPAVARTEKIFPGTFRISERLERAGGEKVKGDSGRFLVTAAAAAAKAAGETPRGGIRLTTSGKFIPAGPTSTQDFDGWKDKKLVDELKEENIELSNLFTLLPGFTKRMTESMKKREIAPLLAEMVKRLCIPPPEKVLVFFMAKSKKELVLAAKLGYREEEIASNLKIPVDQGRIGRALKRMMPLDQKDFEREHRQEPIAQVDTYWKTEVAAPMIQNREVVGVLSAEGFSNYSKNAKKMIAVSANLGAIAIANAEFVATIQRLADSDPLTGLYNKRYFFQRLDDELERARIAGKPLSLFMFDIDYFKKYNDRNGHQAGDEALRITGHILQERKRDSDIAARYGGEEFIVILPETGKDGAYAFAEAIRRAIESTPYPHAESQPAGKVTISGGISTYPDDGASGTALIEISDACLYKSKEAGRNTITRP
jgi:diguanylate cyclase (GGDEF)-like protein